MNVSWDTSQGAPPPVWPPRPPKRRTGLKVVFAAVMLCVGLVVMVSCIAAIGASKAAHPTPSPYPFSSASAMPGPEITASAQEPAVVVTPAGPASTIGEGQFEVGVDVLAGKYRTAGPVESNISMCYVERARNASGEMGAIISNDIVRGPKTVTIKAGEFVTNTGCQTFEKIGG